MPRLSILTGKIVGLPVRLTALTALTALATLVACSRADSISGASSNSTGPSRRGATVVVSPDSATTTVGHRVRLSPTVLNADGTPDESTSVSWTSMNPSVATVTQTGLVIAVSPGDAFITAAANGASTQALVMVSGAGQLAVTTQPSGAVSGAKLSPQPVVQILSSTNSLMSTSSAAVTAAIATGSGALSGTTTVNAVNGVATFTNLTVSGGGPFTLRFTSSGFTSATSASFTLTQTPASLAVQTQPDDANSGISFGAQPVVNILDGNGALVTMSTLPITATITTGTGTLAGTTTVNAVGGVATFTNLQITGPGNFVLTFSTTSSALQPVASTAFTVGTSTVTVVFQDNFESGDFSHAQNGVHWSSVVSLDVTSAISHGGTHAARYREGDSGDWAELRFDGLANLPEVYMQYYLYLPSGNESPSVGPKARIIGGLNDKFFRLWGGGDDGYNFGVGNLLNPFGNKIGASTWGDGSGVNGSLGGEFEFSSTGVQTAMGEIFGDNDAGNVQHASFFTDANRGRWVQIRIRAKNASAANNDGVLQMWIDGNLVISWTTLHNGNIYGVGGPTGYTTGYILGWANNGWPAGQYVYLDDFTITTGGFGAP
jgi:hypothetical protein